MFKGFLEMLQGARAFCVNPEARQHSGFHHPGGGGMSVREAKNHGLIK